MAAFLHVAPAEALLKLRRGLFIQDKFLLLAHDVVERPKAYRLLGEAAPRCFIMLDNSLIELGYPASKDMMQDAYRIMVPNVVVLPDYLKNTKATLEACEEALRKWDLPPHTPYMGVVQGTTMSEIKECLHFYYCDTRIKWVAVPRVLVEEFGTRHDAIKACRSRGFSNIHLLGLSDNLRDDFECAATYHEVRSIDSAVPLRVGDKEHNIELKDLIEGQARQPPRGDFWEKAQSPEWAPSPTALRNIALANRLVHGDILRW